MQKTDLLTEQAQRAYVEPKPHTHHLRYDLVLMLVTIIWGATFLVTKFSLHLVGPFTYLGLCYTVATLTLVLIFHKRVLRITRAELLAGVIVGIALFTGYACQTVGLQWTSVSKAGFITGLYVPLVPLFALFFLRQRVPGTAIVGMFLSVIGLLLLALNKQFTLTFGPGEWLILCCAFGFALHIVFISKFAPTVDVINLAIIQLAVTSLLSFLIVPLAHEPIAPPPLLAWVPILLMGTFDMAFCLLMMNWVQQFMSSTRAALLYSLEPMWAALFGVLLAGDVLSVVAWIGCGCVFVGMVVGRLEKISFHLRKTTAPPEIDV
ncbi:MAG: DMT family transporter [Ktedonobacteraceae bacterium]